MVPGFSCGSAARGAVRLGALPPPTRDVTTGDGQEPWLLEGRTGERVSSKRQSPHTAGLGWWPPCRGHVRRVQGGAPRREAAECRGGSSSEKAEARQRQGQAHTALLPAAGRTSGLPEEPPQGSDGGHSPGRTPPRFPPLLLGAPAGPEGGGSPGPALTMMLPLPPPHRPASSRAAAAPHGRDGRVAAALYRGRHRGSGADRPARDSSVRSHKFAYVANICIHLHRYGGAARQPAGCNGGATEEQHPSTPPGSLPRRSHGRPRGLPEGRAGGHKGWSCYACRSWQRGFS